jgi:hypothetical protein
MSNVRRIRIPVTTDTAGAATAYGSHVTGFLHAIQLVDGDLADGVDVTLTFETDDISLPGLVKADWNTDQVTYPRVLQALNTDGTALTSHCLQLVYGRPKVVIAQGGSVKTGAVVLYITDNP